jgi:hypothetical protein
VQYSTDAGEIIKLSFEEVFSGPCKNYICHPAIKVFFDKTLVIKSLQVVSNIRKRVGYRGSSTSILEII